MTFCTGGGLRGRRGSVHQPSRLRLRGRGAGAGTKGGGLGFQSSSWIPGSQAAFVPTQNQQCADGAIAFQSLLSLGILRAKGNAMVQLRSAGQEPAQQRAAAETEGPAQGRRDAIVDNSPLVVTQRAQIDGLRQGPLAAAQRQRIQTFGPSVQRVAEDAPESALPARAGNRSGLPAQLKFGIESLSGMSMDNVKVHYNSSKPAQLQALAYAQGSDIHLAPGQDQHLPHEAWHVVQQRQGRVPETTQMAGVAVNDAPGLEREADLMGARASGVTQREARTDGNAWPGPGGTSPCQPVVQRKMGFEFETGANQFITNGQTGKRFDRKDIAFDNGRCRLEGDSGFHLEFVTEPYDNWPQLHQAILDAKAVAEDLAQRAGLAQSGEIVVGTAENFAEDDISIRIGDPTFTASVQSTEGVELSGIPGLINEHLHNNGAAAIGQQATAAIGQARQQQNLAQQAVVFPNVLGLIHALVMYIYRAQRVQGDSKDGPKAIFRLMARTDFRSQFRSLTQAERTQFKLILFGNGNADNADSRNNPITHATNVALDANLFAQGYQDEGPPQQNVAGPTLRAWLKSIATAASGRDVLSPPPGYTAHSALQGAAKKFRYGMGAMDMDNTLALFEMRGYRATSGRKNKDNWVPFAQAKYDLAAARNHSLQPRVQPPQLAPPNAQQGAPQQPAVVAQQPPQQAQQPIVVAQPVVVPQPIVVAQPMPQQVVQQLQQQVVAHLPHQVVQPVQQIVQAPQQGGYNLRSRNKRQRVR